MRIEGRDLVNFGQRHLHFGGKRGEMGRGDVAVLILNEMQMFDQQIAPARPVGEQRSDFDQRLRIDLASLGCARRTASTGTGARRNRGGSLFCDAHLFSL